MKILIKLMGSGGELDRQTIQVRVDAASHEVSQHIHFAMEAWVLAPGDTIVISEVEG